MVDQILQKTQATMNHQMFTHIVKLKFHFPVISTVACEVMLKYLITNKTLQVQFHAEVIVSCELRYYMISNRNSKTVQIQFDTEVISSCQLMYCRQYLEGHRKKSHKEVGKGKANLKLIRSVNETFFLFIKYFLLHSIPDFLLRIKKYNLPRNSC